MFFAISFSVIKAIKTSVLKEIISRLKVCKVVENQTQINFPRVPKIISSHFFKNAVFCTLNYFFENIK